MIIKKSSVIPASRADSADRSGSTRKFRYQETIPQLVKSKYPLNLKEDAYIDSALSSNEEDLSAYSTSSTRTRQPSYLDNSFGLNQRLDHAHYTIACQKYSTNSSWIISDSILDIEANPMVLFTKFNSTITLPETQTNTIVINQSHTAFLFKDRNGIIKFCCKNQLSNKDMNWIAKRFNINLLSDKHWLQYELRFNKGNRNLSLDLIANIHLNAVISGQLRKSTNTFNTFGSRTSNPFLPKTLDSMLDFKPDRLSFQNSKLGKYTSQPILYQSSRSTIYPRPLPTAKSLSLSQVTQKLKPLPDPSTGRHTIGDAAMPEKKLVKPLTTQIPAPKRHDSNSAYASTAGKIKEARESEPKEYDVSEEELQSVFQNTKIVSFNKNTTDVSVSADSKSIGSSSKVEEYDNISIDFEEPFSFFFKDGKSLSIDKKDVDRLQGPEFLNDNIILFYLKMIQQEHPELKDQLYVFNSFFYDKLKNHADKKISYEDIRKWTSKANLFSKSFTVVPINHKMHWFVAIIYNLPALLNPMSPRARDQEGENENEEGFTAGETTFQVMPLKSKSIRSSGSFNKDTDCKIFFCDSLQRQNYNYHFKNLCGYFCEEARDKLNQDIDADRITYTSVSVPQQNNLSDCGVYLIHYIELFLKDPYYCVELFLSQSPQSVNALEKYWHKELLKGKRRFLRRKLMLYRDQQIKIKNAKELSINKEAAARRIPNQAQQSQASSDGSENNALNPSSNIKKQKGATPSSKFDSDSDSDSNVQNASQNGLSFKQENDEGKANNNSSISSENEYVHAEAGKYQSPESSNVAKEAANGEDDDDEDALQFISISERSTAVSSNPRSSRLSSPQYPINAGNPVAPTGSTNPVLDTANAAVVLMEPVSPSVSTGDQSHNVCIAPSQDLPQENSIIVFNVQDSFNPRRSNDNRKALFVDQNRNDSFMGQGDKIPFLDQDKTESVTLRDHEQGDEHFKPQHHQINTQKYSKKSRMKYSAVAELSSGQAFTQTAQAKEYALPKDGVSYAKEDKRKRRRSEFPTFSGTVFLSSNYPESAVGPMEIQMQSLPIRLSDNNDNNDNNNNSRFENVRIKRRISESHELRNPPSSQEYSNKETIAALYANSASDS